MTDQPQQHAPAPPKSRLDFWTRGPGIILIIVGVGLVFAAIVAVTGGLEPGGSSKAKDLDVQMTSCSVSGSVAKVGLSVTNRGDRTRSVRIGIEYRDGSGARIDTDTAQVSGIAPGDTARTEETTILDASATSGRCVITSIR